MDFIKAKFIGYTWEIVKHSERRSVYHLTHPAKKSLYVKIYHPKTLFQQLRNRIAPRTLKEARMFEALAASGIKVPKVVDHLRHGTTSALVTEAIEPCTQLHELNKKDQISIMLKIFISLLKNGFTHKDLHAGNVILASSDIPFLVDVYEVTAKKRITKKDIIAMFSILLGIYDIEDNLLTQSLHSLLPKDNENMLIRIIRKHAVAKKRKKVNKWIQRSLIQKDFAKVVSAPSYTALLYQGSNANLEKIIHEHQNNIRNKTNILKYQDKTQLSIVDEYCVKWYRKTTQLQRPYALRAWCGLLTLKFNNIHVPDPVAAIVFKDRSSMLITNALSLPTLDKLLFHQYAKIGIKAKTNLAKHMGKTIGRLHSLHIYHADLKACNILVAEDSEASFFLDTDRVKQLRFISEKRKLKNLVQINTSIPKHVSKNLRMAFIKAYSEVTYDDPRKLFQKVWERSRRDTIIYTTDEGDKRESWT